MKKGCMIACWIGMLAFCGYISCVHGANKMDGKQEYRVTINGIEMYRDAATILLRQIVKDEKDSVRIVDKNSEKKLDVSEEIIKPGIRISIYDSKNVEMVLELLEIVKARTKGLKVGTPAQVILKDKYISLMKLGGQFVISNDETDKGIFLMVNDEMQITKMQVFRSSIPSEIEGAIPMHE